MVESSLDFIKSLAERSSVRTLSLAELDQDARPFRRPTQNRGLSFYSNVRNRSAGPAEVFSGNRVASTGIIQREQAIWDNEDDMLRGVRAYLERATLIQAQRTIGDTPSCNPKCTLLPSLQQAGNNRQARHLSLTLRDHDSSSPGPDPFQVCIPESPANGRQVCPMNNSHPSRR